MCLSPVQFRMQAYGINIFFGVCLGFIMLTVSAPELPDTNSYFSMFLVLSLNLQDDQFRYKIQVLKSKPI